MPVIMKIDETTDGMTDKELKIDLLNIRVDY